MKMKKGVKKAIIAGAVFTAALNMILLRSVKADGYGRHAGFL